MLGKKEKALELLLKIKDDKKPLCGTNKSLILSGIKSEDIRYDLDTLRSALCFLHLDNNVCHSLLLLLQRQSIEEQELQLKHYVELVKFKEILQGICQNDCDQTVNMPQQPMQRSLSFQHNQERPLVFHSSSQHNAMRTSDEMQHPQQLTYLLPQYLEPTQDMRNILTSTSAYVEGNPAVYTTASLTVIPPSNDAIMQEQPQQISEMLHNCQSDNIKQDKTTSQRL